MPLKDDFAKGLAAGDVSAYRRVYDQYGPALYRTAIGMLGSSADAEDAVQDVFVAMVGARGRLEQVANMKAYLFASMRHTVMNTQRRRRRAATGLDQAEAPAGPSVADRDEADRLWDTVARLPTAQREVVALKIKGELTFREIGLVCGVSTNTAASRYRYALAKLKQMLETDPC